METSETPEGHGDMNNMSTQTGVTNPPQVLDKHGNATIYVNESETQNPGPVDRYDRTEKSPHQLTINISH